MSLIASFFTPQVPLSASLSYSAISTLQKTNFGLWLLLLIKFGHLLWVALSEKLTAHTDPVLGSKQEDNNRRGGISKSWLYFQKVRAWPGQTVFFSKRGLSYSPKKVLCSEKRTWRVIDNLLLSETSVQTSL